MTIPEAEAIIREKLPLQLKDELFLSELRKNIFAEKLGCCEDNVGKWAKGTYIPSLPAALAMARTFGISLDLFCTGED